MDDVVVDIARRVVTVKATLAGAWKKLIHFNYKLKHHSIFKAFEIC